MYFLYVVFGFLLKFAHVRIFVLSEIHRGTGNLAAAKREFKENFQFYFVFVIF